MKRLLFILLALCMSVLFINSAKAQTYATAKINSISYQDNKVTVKGKISFESTVQVLVFDGEKPILMGTTELENKNFTFVSDSIDLTNGKTYTVKVSTQDGKCQATKTFIASVENPQTWDNIYTYVIIAIIAIVGIGVGVYYLVKNKKDKKDEL